MKKLAHQIVRLRYAMIALFVGLLIGGIALMPSVVTNYDLSEYLDAGSKTVVALDKMSEAFGSNGSAQIMIQDVSLEAAKELEAVIQDIPGITAVSFDEENGYRDGDALFKLFIDTENYDIATYQTIDAVREALAEHDLAFAGEGIRASYLQRAIKKDLKVILAIVAVVIIAILLVSSTSWVDPLILVLVLGVAVFINLGTNALFEHISFVTRSICIVLQLALSMDYSIILLHAFKDERREGASPTQAAERALAKTFAPVSASSLTTIAGLGALAFMRYAIGLDIGMVLIKGVIISLMTSLLFMPALLVLFAGLLDRAHHRTLGAVVSEKLGRQKKANTGKSFSQFQYKSKLIIPVVLVILIASGAMLQSQLTYEYVADPAKNPADQINVENALIEDAFGVQNSVVIMVPKGDRMREKALVEYLLDYTYEGETVFSSGQGIAYAGLYDAYTASEAAEAFDLAEEMVADAYEAMGAGANDAIALMDLLTYLSDSGYILETAADRQAALAERNQEAQQAVQPMNAALFAQAAVIDRATANTVFQMMGAAPVDEFMMVNILAFIHENKAFSMAGNAEGQAAIDEAYAQVAGATAALSKADLVSSLGLDQQMADEVFTALDAGDTLPAYRVLAYLAEHKSIYARGEEIQARVDDQYRAALDAHEVFESGALTRLIFNMDLPISSDEAFAVIEDLREQVPAFYAESYLLSESATYLDIRDLFLTDMVVINLVSFLAIFAIIMVTFRSLIIPLLLTTLIQGAIWVTMAINAASGTPIFFICYLVILCIQMGATVDYAILMTSEYTRARKTMGARDSVDRAFRVALPTILTSGSILVIAALIVGLFSNVTIISSLGMILSRGCLISLMFTTFALPQLLLLFDRLIVKTTKGLRGTAPQTEA